jgi:hypothetical protein
MAIPKVDALIQFNDQELKTLSSIYDLVVFLVHSGETFLHMLCDAMAILDLDHLFRSFIIGGNEKDSKDAIRLTCSIIALICVILQDLPENSKLIEKIIFHDDIKLTILLRHNVPKVRLRTCHMLRLLGRFCCYALHSYWNSELSMIIHTELVGDEDCDVQKEALNIIEEFKSFGWFKREIGC